MKICYLAMVAALSAPATSFAAGDAAALFKQNNCSACHSISGNSVGPALVDIAAKYKGDKNAQAKLEAKTRSGGAGVFGTMPMPATAKSVSDGDIKAMVAWVLSQK